ncbi:tetratricopeptide repeat protein 25 isoform X1 [Neopelma chrysocephalum]|uniref:tetratricopeptide repeat protein 25 isoform X1 n=1 Tax=Neopelma chrysocephalum TaxID=114329 RepID=UPI000FCCE4B7|nr:tetratricopeptide repeat protein 25 isoform X1 [Neopelma chrysocephalum]
MADPDPGPIVTFGSLITEGTTLSRRGQHRKALGCFNNALKLRAGDKQCLITRSKCFLKLGDTENSLKDAEASLQRDKAFTEGLYQKAETLYTMGDFEFALVFYHRGRRLRPDQHKFQLGINKAEEAIMNCIGNPASVKLENKEELGFVSRQAESRKNNQKLQNLPTKDQKGKKKKQRVKNPKTERELLGQLYDDKTFLQELLKDEDLMQINMRQGGKVEDLVLDGISYLNQRRDFWQQQKPIYARLYERRLLQQRGMGDRRQKPAEVARAIAKDMEDIELMLARGSAEESCRKAERLLKKIQGRAESEVPNKSELIGDLHSCIGNAQVEMGQMEAALRSYRRDLDCARQNALPDSVSRALDNIGRVYARTSRFQQAINTWEKRIPMAKSSLEKACLFHDIGRCYLELGEAETAEDCGEKSLESADEEGDVEWQLHATVLVAQAQVKLKDYRSAILNFEKALEKAKLVPDQAAQNTIIAALDKVSKSYIKQLSKGGKEATARSRKGRDSSRENTKNKLEKDREREEEEQHMGNQDEKTEEEAQNDRKPTKNNKLKKDKEREKGEQDMGNQDERPKEETGNDTENTENNKSEEDREREEGEEDTGNQDEKPKEEAGSDTEAYGNASDGETDEEIKESNGEK